MTMYCKQFFFIALLFPVWGSAKLPESIQWYGFVSPEYSYDSRKMVEARDYHYTLYPKDVDITMDGKDANDVPRTSFTPFNSRIGMKGKDSSGVFGSDYIATLVEADFRGWGDTSTLLRLRKALITFGKENNAYFFGQTYHPFAAPTTFPNTVSYGKGDPYDSAVFVPQLGWNYFFRGQEREESQITITLWSATMGARASGPGNVVSSSYMREGVWPGVNFRMQGLVRELLVGASFDMRPLRPAHKGEILSSGDQYYEHATFNTFAAVAYAEARFNKGYLKIHGALSNGYSDLYAYGGYAVKTFDEKTRVRTYAPLRTMLGWFDSEVEISGVVKPGIFIGVAKNYGAGCRLYQPYNGTTQTYDAPIVYGAGYLIDRMFRIAPRVWIERKNIKFGVEAEWNCAWYGTLDSEARVICPHSVDSIRLLVALFYNF